MTIVVVNINCIWVFILRTCKARVTNLSKILGKFLKYKDTSRIRIKHKNFRYNKDTSRIGIKHKNFRRNKDTSRIGIKEKNFS